MTAVIDLDQLQTDNPEALLKAFDSLESGAEPSNNEPPKEATPPTETPANSEPQPNSEPAGTNQPPQNNSESQDGADAQGVLNQDGKHVIPFSVLKSTRERAYRAEEMLRDAQQKLADLEQQARQGSQGAKPGESARTETNSFASDLSPEDLEALKEDFPTVYKAIQAAEAKFQHLESKLQPVENSVRQVENERAQSVADTVQGAIDSIPKLSHIQANDPAAFDLAIQFDATLRNQAAWADKSYAERFTKVTEMVEAALGEINVPGMGAPTTQKTPEQLKAEAQAIAAKATKSNGTHVPNSLGEAPAGTPAAQDEREAAENLSPLQLAEKFNSMSPDQMDAYFRSL
jgi:hypothetical protein